MLALLLIIVKWLGVLGMIAAAAIGWLAPGALSWEAHYLVGMVSTFVYALAQVMTTYYFIGMRTAIVRAAQKHELKGSFANEAQAIKKRVARLGHFLPLLATATLILAGGVLFGKITPWIHWAAGFLTIVLGIYSGLIEWHAFRDNASLFDRTAAQINSLTTPASEQP